MEYEKIILGKKKEWKEGDQNEIWVCPVMKQEA